MNAAFTESVRRMWTYLCSHSKKNDIKLPFKYSDLCSAVLKTFDGKEDGLVKCSYCHGRFAIDEVAPGFPIPLTRGGAAMLSEMELSCKSCHRNKGELLPDEYLELLKFIDMKISLKRRYILNRNKPKPSVG